MHLLACIFYSLHLEPNCQAPIKQLDRFGWESLKQQGQKAIVVFSKKDCPPCETAKPVVISAALLAEDAGSDIPIVTVCYLSYSPQSIVY
jgi:thioredoxin-related protein